MGVEDEAENVLINPSPMVKGAARLAAAKLADRRGESVYVVEIGEDRDGNTHLIVDREEMRPSESSEAKIKREVDEVLARSSSRRTATATLLTQMIGRRVKSGWHGLVDGKILQWEPFGAGGTNVFVRDAASGRESWYASHGLTPIDGKGPLPSRTEIRKIRQAEMDTSMNKIAKRWEREPPPPRIRR
jgi:hypothetical protein